MNILGIFGIRNAFFVPSMLENRTIAIRFGAATHRVVVYVNGIEIRQHEGGFLPFQADVTNAIRFGEENVVSLKLNNELSRETLPAGDTITLKNGKKNGQTFL